METCPRWHDPTVFLWVPTTPFIFLYDDRQQQQWPCRSSCCHCLLKAPSICRKKGRKQPSVCTRGNTCFRWGRLVHKHWGGNSYFFSRSPLTFVEYSISLRYDLLSSTADNLFLIIPDQSKICTKSKKQDLMIFKFLDV